MGTPKTKNKQKNSDCWNLCSVRQKNDEIDHWYRSTIAEYLIIKNNNNNNNNRPHSCLTIVA